MNRRSGMTAILALCGAISACGWFSVKPSPENQPPLLQVVWMAEAGVNPGCDGYSQPVRVCLWLAPQSGWIPEGALTGAACAGGSGRAKLLYRDILRPGAHRQRQVSLPALRPVWLVIGAEFQQQNGVRSLQEVPLLSDEDRRLTIRIYRNGIAAVTGTKE